MPVAVKTRPISIQFKPRTPQRVIRLVKSAFADYLFEEKDHAEDWFKTDLHKEIVGRMKPGDYLRQFRVACGKTQKALAEEIGLPVAYVSDMETGQRAISRKNAKTLARIFGVNPGVFI